MSNLLVRALSGFVFVFLLISCILYSESSLSGMLFIMMLLCVYEFKKMTKLSTNMVYVSASFIFLSQVPSLSSEPLIRIGLYSSLIIPFLHFVFDEKSSVTNLSNFFLSLVYIALPFTAMLLLPYLSIHNTLIYYPKILLACFIMIWCNDTFAYLVGKYFGKHKLLERVSPKKTIEGFIGGFIFTLFSCYLIAIYFETLLTIQWLIIGVIIGIFGVIGDLTESAFKRKFNIKDSSQLIPGHGGFLDRLDSIIVAAPIVYIYLQTI